MHKPTCRRIHRAATFFIGKHWAQQHLSTNHQPSLIINNIPPTPKIPKNKINLPTHSSLSQHSPHIHTIHHPQCSQQQTPPSHLYGPLLHFPPPPFPFPPLRPDTTDPHLTVRTTSRRFPKSAPHAGSPVHRWRKLCSVRGGHDVFGVEVRRLVACLFCGGCVGA